jgi:hypothetical protein
MNLSNSMTGDYVQMDTWSIRKNEPKTNPNEPNLSRRSLLAKPETNPILANKTTIRTQNKSNSNPIYPVVASGEAGTNPSSGSKNAEFND